MKNLSKRSDVQQCCVKMRIVNSCATDIQHRITIFVCVYVANVYCRSFSSSIDLYLENVCNAPSGGDNEVLSMSLEKQNHL